MSLTKVSYAMTNGAPANVLDFGAVGDGVADDTAAVQAAVNASTNTLLYFPTGTYKLTSAVTGNGSQIVLFDAGATTTGSSLTGINNLQYQLNASSMLRLRRYVPTPTTVFPTILNIVSGKGNNTTTIGVSGGYFQSRDETDVDATTKGCLYGLQLSLVPRVLRDNVGIDDVAGLVVQNDSTTPGARATDALYVGRNSSNFPGDDFEWITGQTIAANCGYAHRTTGASFTKFDAAGRMAGTLGNTYGFVGSATVQASVTSSANYFRSEAKTIDSAFTLPNLYHFRSTQSSFGASSTVTNQYGFSVSPSMIGATNNYGFYGDIPAGAPGTSRWNLYMAGSASNYFASDLTIHGGTAIPAGGTTGEGYKFSATPNFGIFFGSGAPTLTAAKGSLYMRSDGSTTNNRMYVNTDGGTTWTSVITAA